MPDTRGGYRPNAGRKKGSKTILRAQLIELADEFDSVVGNKFQDIIANLVRLALESEDENIQLKASQYLTNQLLGMPTQRTENTTEIIGSEEIEKAKAMLKEKVGTNE